jgi:hypothetical protein
MAHAYYVWMEHSGFSVAEMVEFEMSGPGRDSASHIDPLVIDQNRCR